MPAGDTIQGLIEGRIGFRIDVTRLSSRLRGRLEQLQAMMLRLNQLDDEIVKLEARRFRYIVLLLTTSAFAVMGLSLGLSGFLGGHLDGFGAVVPLVASGAVLGGDYFVGLVLRKVRALHLLDLEESVELARDLDAGITSAYHDVLDELTTRLRPSQGRQSRNY